MARLAKSEEEKRQQALQRGLLAQLHQFSRNLIYITMMRSGGEPFGAPFEVGTPTLTERIVKLFRQKSFFSFETLEKLQTRSHRNKYTRHGAAPHRGPYTHLPEVRSGRGFVARFLTYLRDNRFFMSLGAARSGQPARRPTRSRPDQSPQPLDLL